MSGLCPSKKMSCIGKYCRNVIDLKETIYLVVYFSLGALVNLFCINMFTRFESFLHPQVSFFLSTIFWVTLVQLPILYLTIKLTIRVIPSVKVVPTPNEFYVLKPIFEPRRLSLKAHRSPSGYNVVPYPNVLCITGNTSDVSKSPECEKKKIQSAFSRLQAKQVHGKLSLLKTINTQKQYMGKGKSKGKSIGKGKGKITPKYISPEYQGYELSRKDKRKVKENKAWREEDEEEPVEDTALPPESHQDDDQEELPGVLSDLLAPKDLPEDQETPPAQDPGQGFQLVRPPPAPVDSPGPVDQRKQEVVQDLPEDKEEQPAPDPRQGFQLVRHRIPGRREQRPALSETDMMVRREQIPALSEANSLVSKGEADRMVKPQRIRKKMNKFV